MNLAHDRGDPSIVIIPRSRGSSKGEFAHSAELFCAAEFATGRVWTRLSPGDSVDVGPVPPHGCGVLKIACYDPGRPSLAWTDGHFSMGGREIVQWREGANEVELTVDWRWRSRLRVKLLPPEGRAFEDTDMLSVEGLLDEPQTFRMRWR